MHARRRTGRTVCLLTPRSWPHKGGSWIPAGLETRSQRAPIASVLRQWHLRSSCGWLSRVSAATRKARDSGRARPGEAPTAAPVDVRPTPPRRGSRSPPRRQRAGSVEHLSVMYWRRVGGPLGKARSFGETRAAHDAAVDHLADGPGGVTTESARLRLGGIDGHGSRLWREEARQFLGRRAIPPIGPRQRGLRAFAVGEVDGFPNCGA